MLRESEMRHDVLLPVLRETNKLVLETERLTLRQPQLADVQTIVDLANDRRIAENTRRMPYPYQREDAVRLVQAMTEQDRKTVFLIEHDHNQIGVVSVDWREPNMPELGCWLGVAYWGQGFAIEAARALIDFTFEEYDIEQLVAGSRVTNPTSRHNLEKCGFQWAGVQLHRFQALGSSTPVDFFRLSRSVWFSLRHWSNSTRRMR